MIAASIERVVEWYIIAKYKFVSARRSVEVKDLILAGCGRRSGGGRRGWRGVAFVDIFAISAGQRSGTKVLIATPIERVVSYSLENENGIGAHRSIEVKDLSIARCRCGGDGSGSVADIDVLAITVVHGPSSVVDVAALHCGPVRCPAEEEYVVGTDSIDQKESLSLTGCRCGCRGRNDECKGRFRSGTRSGSGSGLTKCGRLNGNDGFRARTRDGNETTTLGRTLGVITRLGRTLQVVTGLGRTLGIVVAASLGHHGGSQARARRSTSDEAAFASFGIIIAASFASFGIRIVASFTVVFAHSLGVIIAVGSDGAHASPSGHVTALGFRVVVTAF